MPSYSSVQPFSSGDDISDEDWNAAVQQWKANQGRWDPVAGGRPGDPDMTEAPAAPDTILQLAQAQMPHGAWQALRARQLSAGDDAAGSAGDGPPAPAPGGAPAAERMADAAGAEGQAYRDGIDLIRQGLGSAGRFLQRQFVGSNGEPATSSNPVVRWAQAHEGQFGYTRINTAADARGQITDHEGPIREIGEPKCNQFVFDALTAAGAPPSRMEGGRIPVAKDWGDPRSRIGGYAPVSGAPLPGDVVSDGEHVGIYAPLPNGAPGTISAASPNWPVFFHGPAGVIGGVVHNDWGYRSGQRVTVWRQAK